MLEEHPGWKVTPIQMAGGRLTVAIQAWTPLSAAEGAVWNKGKMPPRAVFAKSQAWKCVVGGHKQIVADRR